jgi:hypothetical protein
LLLNPRSSLAGDFSFHRENDAVFFTISLLGCCWWVMGGAPESAVRALYTFGLVELVAARRQST